MSTFPRSKTRRAIDWGQSKLKKGGDDRSVIRLYAEISLFSHSTTISLSPFITRPRKCSRAFPSFSERFRAFRSFLRFPSQYSRAQLIEARSTLHCVTQIRHQTLRTQTYPSIRYRSRPSRTPVSYPFLFDVKFIPSSVPQTSLFSYTISHRHSNAPLQLKISLSYDPSFYFLVLFRIHAVSLAHS